MADYSEEHVCQIAYGYEPNYDDHEECATYWSCEDYVGKLFHCKGSKQFNWQYKQCMNDDDVSCYVQKEKYFAYGTSSYSGVSSSSFSSYGSGERTLTGFMTLTGFTDTKRIRQVFLTLTDLLDTGTTDTTVTIRQTQKTGKRDDR